MTDDAIRLKRLRIRSWRRGTKEMDLILGPFFDARGTEMDAGTLDRYEELLNENDQDLYQWFSGQSDAPDELASLLDVIRVHHATGAAQP